MQKTLNILLPVLNEQYRLESGVRTLRAFMIEHNIPCILTIIDNGSTDHTQEIALSLADSGGGAMDYHDFDKSKSRNDGIKVDSSNEAQHLTNLAQDSRISKDAALCDEKTGQSRSFFSRAKSTSQVKSPIAIEYLRLNQKGVGLALQAGIDHNNSRKYKSAFIGYMDIDLSTNLCHLLEVYESLCAGSAVVVGSRLLQDSKVIGRSLKREIISRSLNAIIKATLHTSFSDAMCGFKFYQADIATLLRQKCSDDPSWFYCAQMLIQAQALGIEIEEIPVQWEDDSLGSKVQITNLARIYLKEIYRLRTLRQAILAHKHSKLPQNNAVK